jgi:Zn finger protein HypA/HybF involved in hydrogenase expression
VIAMKVECALCGPVECRLNDLNLICPTCGATIVISSGRDMRVDYLDID